MGGVDDLERLAALHAAGQLTDEEFAAAKGRVLAARGDAATAKGIAPSESSQANTSPAGKPSEKRDLRRIVFVAAAVAATAAVAISLLAASSENGGDTFARSLRTTTSGAVSATAGPDSTVTAAPTTVPDVTTTTAPPPPQTTATTLPIPGSVCIPGSFPDCIDPGGDGLGIYLIDGAACEAALGVGAGECDDLDGDGVAGYPDTG